MDHDDSMVTSPSSQGDENYDDDNLFPESNTEMAPRPHTPQNDHLNAAAPGELSPPRSQTNVAEDTGSRATMTTMMDDTEDLSPTAANRTVMKIEEEWKPGQGWKSKTAQEEMQRAWDNVVDKEFSLKEFGDVMAHRLSK